MKRFTVLMIAAVLAQIAVPEGQRDTPALADLLRGAGVYAERFERDFALIVGEEHYVQQVRPVPIGSRPTLRRTIVSDILFMWPSENSLLVTARSFRTVDDMPVADSASRLDRLLASATADSAEKERLLRDESARFNVGSVIRNFGDPTLVLQFLHQRLQSRFLFRLAGQENVAGVPTWKLSYMERKSPTLIAVNDRNALASGDVWIAVANNALVRARLRLTDNTVDARVEMTYSPDAGWDVWVPRTMTERYELRVPYPGGRSGGIEEDIFSTATYSNFRRFETSGRLVSP